MTQISYVCNNPKCKKVKGESNHWVAVRVKSGGSGLILSSLTIVSFEDCGPEDEHYCGPACATKRFTEFVDQLRAESTALARKNAEDQMIDLQEVEA